MKNRIVATDYVGNFKGGRKKSKTNTVTCYECGKDGHIKPECPELKNGQKADSKYPQDKRRSKQRKAYIAWENNDDDTSSDVDQSVEEESNLCFMAGSAHSKECDSDFENEPIEVQYYMLVDTYR